MNKLNWAKGFKRIVWILSVALAIVGLSVFVYGSVIGIVHARQLNHDVKLKAEIQNGDPEFLGLSAGAQKIVMDRLNSQIKKLNEDRDWQGFLWGGLLFSASSFILLWAVFFAIRWIARGFVDRDVPE